MTDHAMHPTTTAPRRTLTLITLLALSSAAMAHTGADGTAHHGAAFMDGLLHPWGGLDHLAAMVAVGIWSGLTARRWWVSPLAFASMLLAGALLGLAGVGLPAVEPMIASSLVVIGLLLAARTQMPLPFAAALVGLFAVFHGVAHGVELSGAVQPWAPLLGMVVSTLTLHALGIAGGLALRHRHLLWARAAGLGVALTGGALLWQLA